MCVACAFIKVKTTILELTTTITQVLGVRTALGVDAALGRNIGNNPIYIYI